MNTQLEFGYSLRSQVRNLLVLADTATLSQLLDIPESMAFSACQARKEASTSFMEFLESCGNFVDEKELKDFSRRVERFEEQLIESLVDKR